MTKEGGCEYIILLSVSHIGIILVVLYLLVVSGQALSVALSKWHPIASHLLSTRCVSATRQ